MRNVEKPILLKLLKEEVRLNKLNRRLELIEEEITPEDLARSNELLEANWPFSQKDMDGAVATLIEYGTLPKDTKSPKVR